MYNDPYSGLNHEQREGVSLPAAAPAGYNYSAAWPQQASYAPVPQVSAPSVPVYQTPETSTYQRQLAGPMVYQNYAYQQSLPVAQQPLAVTQTQPIAQQYSVSPGNYAPSQQSSWPTQQAASFPPALIYPPRDDGSEGDGSTGGTSYRSSSEEDMYGSEDKGKSVSISPTNQFFAHAPPENWQTQGDRTILHMYRPPPSSGGSTGTGGMNVNTSALVAVFKQDPDGAAKLRTPNTACYHCKHRRIKCEDKIYTTNGRAFCSACVQRQGPCYWPPRFYPYLQADYLTARRAQIQASNPQMYETLMRSGELDDSLLREFDPTKCPKPLSWTWGYNPTTGRKEFDDVPLTGKEKVPKRRKTLEDYWWDRW